MRKDRDLLGERTFSHLVVIGSSAGGIEALSELVSTLPEGFSAPIVVAQHLDPERASHLEEILSRRSTLPVHDGVGLDGEGVGSASGGLRSVKERTALLGGEFRLSPGPGVGTKVVVSIPLAREQ